MAEPLTKDKVIEADNLVMNKKHELYVSKEQVISVKDLKSALEEFERLIEKEGDFAIRANGTKIGVLLRKAFPAIYEE